MISWFERKVNNSPLKNDGFLLKNWNGGDLKYYFCWSTCIINHNTYRVKLYVCVFKNKTHTLNIKYIAIKFSPYNAV